jgi:cyclopropane fatty-acyl-phospholipid synthase-like methyltransferase
MALPNAKSKIIEHYDVVSPYYYKLWGEHLHHGYWIRGDESKEKAQQQLIEHLARLAKIPQGAVILDVGCGFGASSLYLCKQFGATSTGITISQVQVEMANAAAARERADARFCLMDAEAMTFEKPFDVVWSVESISHYQDREKFFASAARLLKPGGIIALTDWFKKPNLSHAELREYIAFERNGNPAARRVNQPLCPDVGHLFGNHRRHGLLVFGCQTRQELRALSELFPGDARWVFFRGVCLRVIGGSQTRPG